MNIIGSGLAALIAGTMNENARLFEPMSSSKSHQALLRFRSPQIGEAVGIPFRKVTAYKNIHYCGDSVPLSNDMMIMYSRKVAGSIGIRSIANLESEDRWIAPEDFQDRLRDMCSDRIEYDVAIGDVLRRSGPVISTIPMNVLAEYLQMQDTLGSQIDIVKDVRPIYVTKFHIMDCDVFMTNYFPDPGLALYRASISGDMLIMEGMMKMDEDDYYAAIRSFGLQNYHMTLVRDNVKQQNGKMTPINDGPRKNFIFRCTLEHNIYSLGRFAIWKNILLDDVYQDILRIKQFIQLEKYDHYKENK